MLEIMACCGEEGAQEERGKKDDTDGYDHHKRQQALPQDVHPKAPRLRRDFPNRIHCVLELTESAGGSDQQRNNAEDRRSPTAARCLRAANDGPDRFRSVVTRNRCNLALHLQRSVTFDNQTGASHQENE